MHLDKCVKFFFFFQRLVELDRCVRGCHVNGGASHGVPTIEVPCEVLFETDFGSSEGEKIKPIISQIHG